MDLGISLFDFLIEAELHHYYDQIKTDLKILKTSQLKYVTDEDLTLLGMSRPEQRRLKKFFTKYYPQNYLSRIKRLLGPGKKDEHSSWLGALSEERAPELLTEAPESRGPGTPNKHIIPAESITINKELGVGEFGVVQQGVWTNDGHRIQVAIKCLSRERMHTNSMEFLKEAAIMYSIEHRSIVRLYGVVLHPDSLMLVTELAPLRSLLECLKEISLRTSFPVLTLCEFALQICEGMSYLENKRLIHRDLAARNILVFTKNKVKISDFGLSRALGVGKDYYQTNFNVNLKLPIAWCAPECISYLRFTSASDVWAYAVTLWEMFSYGFQPWAAFSGHQILVAIDAPNFQRLEQPECCPREYFALMQKCWHHESTKRPKFSEILHMLPDCKPEQVQAVSTSEFDPNTKRSDQLFYRGGEIITVIDKGGNPAATQWKGILANGTTGLFNPQNVVSYLGASLPSSANQNVFTRSTGEGAGSSIRNSLIRDRSASKRRLRSDMISAPQGEVKHTGHVGLDGAYFGDVSFLEYNHLPRQVVTPYKPSEDLEQTPLINPNSPSHLTGNNTVNSAHPILLRETQHLHNAANHDANEGEANKYRNSASFSLDSISHQVPKTMWPRSKKPSDSHHSGKARNAEANHSNESDGDIDPELQPHEYQEISDDDDQKPSADFGQPLLEEMESIFRSLGAHSKAPAATLQDHEGTNHRNELTELSSRLNHTATLSKKKQTTVKAISGHDKKMLDSAIALANELTAKSMTDLEHKSEEVPRTPTTPNERSKFHFRFPLGGHSHASSTLKADSKPTDTYGNKMDKRTFSQEAQSVPDIQSSLTEEGKLAYESLVEQPARLVKTLINIRQKQGPKSSSQAGSQAGSHSASQAGSHAGSQVSSQAGSQAGNQAGGQASHLSKGPQHHAGESHLGPKYDLSLGTAKAVAESSSILTELLTISLNKMEPSPDKMVQDTGNALPLPPRDRTVVSQSSRKRHTRKYPLIIHDSNLRRTLNRLNHQPLSEHCVITSFEKSPQSNSNVKDRIAPADTRSRIPSTSDFVSSHNFSMPYENSNVGHYQNVFTKFPFTSQDSFDTHSIKFEAQLENNFASVDCCDGLLNHDDFELDISAPKNESNISTTSVTSATSTTSTTLATSITSATSATSATSTAHPACASNGNEINQPEDDEPAKAEEYLYKMTNLDNMEYIDGVNGYLNPFAAQIDESCNTATNPFSDQNLTKRNVNFSSQPPSELARNALFNKIKTDLQNLDMVKPKEEGDSNDNVPEEIEEGNLVNQSELEKPLSEVSVEVNTLDEQALPTATYESGENSQRYSLGGNIDDQVLAPVSKQRDGNRQQSRLGDNADDQVLPAASKQSDTNWQRRSIGDNIEDLPAASKQSDANWQRRSLIDNIDELEPCMFAKGSPDRVSVEDLLEFADHKPCGRQRGTESDEVRIMCKVLNHQEIAWRNRAGGDPVGDAGLP